MGKPVLLLRLEGPLQAWGERARWDVRDTAREPTKSGVIGLLGCALGYAIGDRRLEDELDAGLRFGVRVENPGTVLRDFQTIDGFLPVADGRFRGQNNKYGKTVEEASLKADYKTMTIVSPREYLEDAAFLTALEETVDSAGESLVPGLLQRCAHAMRNPVWPLYLGRKACIPTRPIFEELTDHYDGIDDALLHHPFAWAPDRDNKHPEQLHGSVENPAGPSTRQDAFRVNPTRVYGFRGAKPLCDLRSSREDTT